MSLIFIGLGLWDEKDLTIRGLEKARKADRVYLELYTSKTFINVERLEELVCKRIEVLERHHLEEESLKLVEEASERDVVLLVPGDPFVATTHSSILVDAKKRGVEVEIVHNASIISAIVGVTGLHSYRFGKTATISFPYKNRVSRYPADVIKQNLSINAHTLLLLDITPHPMKICEAVEILGKIDRGLLNLFSVGVARVGGDSRIFCDRLVNLKDKNFGDPPHSIVVLAKTLHITEYEFLKEFGDAPEDLRDVVE